ncbi:sce7726 family protein [Fictibacillus sp. KU28468]|uniref:sce7726 family protein n=1 Tax=Fictibacillus sp. KU28468 TaxID=2991053 RepID=UPI00223E78A7|nr:sce7726 family protein [Fictibacillus sp. KU28468]UZJ78752.1 sce7726 family protein [Fictibacillus sp. KU28468]
MDKLFTDVFDSKVFNEELKKNYNFLKNGYRNEFFFKNTLFNKLVLGKYSLTTTAAFAEVIVKKSKADFVLINRNKGMVYEIKTDLDNLDRLVYQLDDYSSAFNLVYVVTSEKNYYPVYKVVKELNPSVGIIVLTENVNLSLRRKAIENDSNLNHEVLFKLLRKKEYEQILLMKYGTLPKVTPVLYFKTSLHWFKEINIKEAQSLVFYMLRQRNDIEGKSLLKALPMEIRWLVYTSKFKYSDLLQIYDKLNLS